MKKKLKKINWSKVNTAIFGLYALVAVLGVYFSERYGLILITFFVYATYTFYVQAEEFVKIYRINSNINIQRYLDERGLKKEDEE